MGRRTMLIPSLDWVTVDRDDTHCEMCGFWFPGGTSWEARQEHDLRCIERKVAENEARRRRGQMLTTRGWRYEDGRWA